MLIALDADRKVNPALVASIVWDRRHYANAGPDSILVVTMVNGEVHRVKHEPQYLGGADAYAVEAKIVAAANMERQFLVDLCFALAIRAADGMHTQPKDIIAKWVAENLSEAGIRTEPRGMSWGVIVDG